MLTNNLELRAALAGLALQGILSGLKNVAYSNDLIADAAVKLADAVLHRLENDGSEPTKFYVNQD
jgi:hypothetical protein